MNRFRFSERVLDLILVLDKGTEKDWMLCQHSVSPLSCHVVVPPPSPPEARWAKIVAYKGNSSYLNCSAFLLSNSSGTDGQAVWGIGPYLFDCMNLELNLYY